jgi:thioredoxin-related protein
MKHIVLFATVIMFLPALAIADGKKKSVKKVAPVEETGPSEIHWITSIDELQAKMAKSPKKVYMDVYTDWCGWCKKMDATTFTNPSVIRYMNQNFYCFRFNAERRDTMRFKGKEYYFKPEYKCNTLAAELMNGQMSYPTTILMMEKFEGPQPIPGYLNVNQIEPILTYFGDNIYKHQSWADFSKDFKPVWKVTGEPDMTPPAGH